jgi:hypothetical protein
MLPSPAPITSRPHSSSSADTFLQPNLLHSSRVFFLSTSGAKRKQQHQQQQQQQQPQEFGTSSSQNIHAQKEVPSQSPTPPGAKPPLTFVAARLVPPPENPQPQLVSAYAAPLFCVPSDSTNKGLCRHGLLSGQNIAQASLEGFLKYTVEGAVNHEILSLSCANQVAVMCHRCFMYLVYNRCEHESHARDLVH